MATQNDELRRAFEESLSKTLTLAREVSPITPGMAASAPTWRAAYSDRTAALMAAFCQIAYVRFEDPSGVERQTMEAQLAAGGFRLIQVYNVNACTQAYLAVSDEFSVLAFRGTESATDWRVNFTIGLDPLSPEHAGVRVHRGFLQAFRSVEADLRRDIDAHVPPDKGLYITGHSLGGALAQVASAAFHRDNLAACYTFGSPRVGGAKFDDHVKCPHYRVVNRWDIVPGLPPPIRGYRHGGDARALGKRGDNPHRRQRATVTQVLISIWAPVAYLFSRRLVLVDDHMIDRYRDKLAVLITTPVKPPPDPLAPKTRTDKPAALETADASGA